MLVLNIKEGDYVLIGDNIQVYFEHKVGRDTLDLAINEPKEMLILRKKLHEKAGSGKPVKSKKKMRPPARLSRGGI